MNDNDAKRFESDSMGEVAIPDWAYWGAQTQRAVDNFTVSSYRIPVPMLEAIVKIKRLAAIVNAGLGLIEPRISESIVAACDEILKGSFALHFPVDVFQTGSGTSWNMNVNEVIANRANAMLGRPLGTRHPVHPNDHVNRGQSSNDVIPSAINVATRVQSGALITALASLAKALGEKEREFSDVIKVGRTHLQDAVPITLGQEFSGYRTQVEKAARRIEAVLPDLEELPIGGTALGTGINTHPRFASGVVSALKEETGVEFREAVSKFEGIAARDAQVALAGALNSAAVSLMKIANDVRLLASGPRTGFGEIRLPALQPGSSIMPGKTNPVIPEMLIQACAHVIGKAVSVSIAGTTGPLDLNIMQPLIAFECLSSLEILAHAVRLFETRCVAGIDADRERCGELVEQSLALVTPLALKIGYDRASAIAKTALEERKTVREIAIREGVVTAEEAAILFDPAKML